MHDKYDLTKGRITNKLFLVAAPIIATSLIQMTYNLTDMYWLGKLSSEAVAASGTVGMYIWLTMAFMVFGRSGAEIGVSQSLGAGEKEEAKNCAQAALQVGFISGLTVAAVYMLLNRPLIAFFGIQDKIVVQMAESYLFLVSIGIPFNFAASTATGVFNASGNSRLPFLINSIGLAINVVLDPILIFTFDMGVEGAAIATFAAQIITCLISFIALKKSKNRPFETFTVTGKIPLRIITRFAKWSLPISFESFCFTFLSMIISIFVARFGTNAIAAQKVGSQIESIGWLITGGFSSAMVAFVGQNYGAGRGDRIKQSSYVTGAILAGWGLFLSLALYFAAEPLFRFFIPDDESTIAYGIMYLEILAVPQLLSGLEGVAQGTFRGIGKTLPPTIVSIVSNVFRTLLAFYFTFYTDLGVKGIFLALAVGMFLRGGWMFVWYGLIIKRLPGKGRTEKSHRGE